MCIRDSDRVIPTCDRPGQFRCNRALVRRHRSELPHREIWTGLTIPDAELNDLDSMAIRTDERSSEISGEPTRLQLQL